MADNEKKSGGSSGWFDNALRALRNTFGGQQKDKATQEKAGAHPEKFRAFVSTLIPTLLPVVFEKGVPGYENAPMIVSGEKRLTLAQLRALLVASAIFGVQEYAGRANLDPDKTEGLLLGSVGQLRDISVDEKALIIVLLTRFRTFNIIRAEHAFEDWICEALWPEFQSVPYAYPSAMSDAIAFGLSREILNKCTLDYLNKRGQVEPPHFFGHLN